MPKRRAFMEQEASCQNGHRSPRKQNRNLHFLPRSLTAQENIQRLRNNEARRRAWSALKLKKLPR
jgi:hypothetical protein